MKKFFEESWLVLMMGVVFALLLAGTQQKLIGKIQENREAELNSAIAEVVPATAGKPEKITIDGNDVYRCLDKDQKFVGWAVKASGMGFIDKIEMVVGLSADGREILGIKVIQHVETPGLGNKIESKKGNPFPVQFAGKSTEQRLKLVKGEPTKSNEVQAITGATYSSTYVTSIVNDVLERIRPKLPAQ